MQEKETKESKVEVLGRWGQISNRKDKFICSRFLEEKYTSVFANLAIAGSAIMKSREGSVHPVTLTLHAREAATLLPKGWSVGDDRRPK